MHENILVKISYFLTFFHNDVELGIVKVSGGCLTRGDRLTTMEYGGGKIEREQFL